MYPRAIDDPPNLEPESSVDLILHSGLMLLVLTPLWLALEARFMSRRILLVVMVLLMVIMTMAVGVYYSLLTAPIPPKIGGREGDS